MTNLILRATRGEDLLSQTRWPAPLQNDPEYAQLVDDIIAPEHEFERALARWLAQRAR